MSHNGAPEADVRRTVSAAQSAALVAIRETLYTVPSFGGCPVPTRNIMLTPEQDAFIEDMLEAGEYRNASEAMRDAVLALQQRRAVEARKSEALRAAVAQGTAALDRREYVEIDGDNLEAWFDQLAETSDP